MIRHLKSVRRIAREISGAADGALELGEGYWGENSN